MHGKTITSSCKIFSLMVTNPMCSFPPKWSARLDRREEKERAFTASERSKATAQEHTNIH